MRLDWTERAELDREYIVERIAEDHVRAAVEMGDRIVAEVKALARFPEAGRSGRVKGTREWPISKSQYVVAYKLDGDVVRILRVMHGKQEWPEGL